MDFVQKKLGMFSIPYYPPFRRGYALAYLAYTCSGAAYALPRLPSSAHSPLPRFSLPYS